jgi:hypothetical protein
VWERLCGAAVGVARKIANTQADRAFLLDSVWWRFRAAHKRAVCAMSLRSSYSSLVVFVTAV